MLSPVGTTVSSAAFWNQQTPQPQVQVSSPGPSPSAELDIDRQVDNDKLQWCDINCDHFIVELKNN